MLDLNVVVFPSAEGELMAPEKRAGEAADDSGASDSSVVTQPGRGGDDDQLHALDFDILKPAEHHERRQQLVTRQLFPAAGDGRPASPASSSTSRPHWADLGPVAGVKGWQLPQQRQQAKKSRRGPRSRSSQYRGVTFYRRTGRWESHIWYNFF